MKSWKDHLEGLKEVLVHAYILQIPFSWRYIFDPSRSLWNNSFNEYMDISLYVGEVLILFALLTHILQYIIEEKSILRSDYKIINDMFHVEHYRSLKTIIFSAFLLLMANTAVSIDRALSLITALHYLSFFIFGYLFIGLFVSRGTIFLRSVLYVFLVSLIIQFSISLFQISQNTSVGLKFLNESILSTDSVNVAKSNLFSDVRLRAYGTFPHPNILSAYVLLIAIYFFSILRLKLFHVKQPLIYLFVFLVASIVVFTQSKLNTIFFIIIILYYLNEKHHLFHVKQMILGLFLVTIIAIYGILVLNTDAKRSFDTRLFQYQDQIEVIKKYTLFGSGIGTYRLSYDKNVPDWWNYEPVHFVPLIALSELGLIVTLTILAWLIKNAKDVPRETWMRHMPLGAFILFVSLSDHYVWDIYQGSFIFAMALLTLYIDKYYIILHYNKSLEERGK